MNVILVFVSLLLSGAHSETYNVLDYGALGDGKHLDTVAIRKAFAAAGANPGSTVVFPEYRTYLTAPLNLSSETTVIIEPQATILGAQDKSLYPIIAPLPSYGRSRDVGWSRYQSLILGVHVKNVRLHGGGTIDGQGKYWWKQHDNHDLKHGRPRLFECMWCDTLEIADLNFQNSGFWAVHPIYSTNVHIHGVTVENPNNTPNTDGIDPDSSSNVLIENCSISVDDDHIAIKSGLDQAGLKYNWPAQNITIRHSDFYRGYGISIGSETSGGIHDVYIHDCTMHFDVHVPKKGTFIKTALGRGNVISNIRYENLKFELAEDLIVIDMGIGEAEWRNVSTIPVIRNVTWVNIEGNGVRHGQFSCLSQSPCKGLVLDGVKTRALEEWECENAYGVQTDMHPKSCIKET